MKILNTVHYTVYSAPLKAHIESSVYLSSRQPLTHKGAQRIVRRAIKGANVQRVESMVDER